MKRILQEVKNPFTIDRNIQTIGTLISFIIGPEIQFKVKLRLLL